MVGKRPTQLRGGLLIAHVDAASRTAEDADAQLGVMPFDSHSADEPIGSLNLLELSLSQGRTSYFARERLGQGFHQLDDAWIFIWRYGGFDEVLKLFYKVSSAGRLMFVRYHERLDQLAAIRVRRTDDRAFPHGGMRQQRIFHFRT